MPIAGKSGVGCVAMADAAQPCGIRNVDSGYGRWVSAVVLHPTGFSCPSTPHRQCCKSGSLLGPSCLLDFLSNLIEGSLSLAFLALDSFTFLKNSFLSDSVANLHRAIECPSFPHLAQVPLKCAWLLKIMGDLDLPRDRVNDLDLVLLDGPSDLLTLCDLYGSGEADLLRFRGRSNESTLGK